MQLSYGIIVCAVGSTTVIKPAGCSRLRRCSAVTTGTAENAFSAAVVTVCNRVCKIQRCVPMSAGQRHRHVCRFLRSHHRGAASRAQPPAAPFLAPAAARRGVCYQRRAGAVASQRVLRCRALPGAGAARHHQRAGVALLCFRTFSHFCCYALQLAVFQVSFSRSSPSSLLKRL